MVSAIHEKKFPAFHHQKNNENAFDIKIFCIALLRCGVVSLLREKFDDGVVVVCCFCLFFVVWIFGGNKYIR